MGARKADRYAKCSHVGICVGFVHVTVLGVCV